MATVTIHTSASAERVLGLLRDAQVYPRWVVGTRTVIDVEDGWPTPGTAFVHQVGLGPLRVTDRTRLVSDDGGRLVLDARAQPVGRARVELRVTSTEDGGATVELTEIPESGPARYVPKVVLEPLTRVRNRRGLRQLRAIAEGR